MKSQRDKAISALKELHSDLDYYRMITTPPKRRASEMENLWTRNPDTRTNRRTYLYQRKRASAPNFFTDGVPERLPEIKTASPRPETETPPRFDWSGSTKNAKELEAAWDSTHPKVLVARKQMLFIGDSLPVPSPPRIDMAQARRRKNADLAIRQIRGSDQAIKTIHIIVQDYVHFSRRRCVHRWVCNIRRDRQFIDCLLEMMTVSEAQHIKNEMILRAKRLVRAWHANLLGSALGEKRVAAEARKRKLIEGISSLLLPPLAYNLSKITAGRETN